jgi:hypothetical protein
MARPRYIVCSENQLVDPANGLVSHVNVVDRLGITRQSSPSLPQGTTVFVPIVPIGKLICSAVWTRDEGDEGAVFEYEMRFHKPGEDSPKVMQTGELSFAQRFFRIDAGLLFTTRTNFIQSGELIVECRIRRRGSDDWQSQSFAIDVEVTAGATSELADSPAEAANR